jgi:acetoin utilization protein AcuB
MMNESVSQIMTREVITVTADDTLDTVQTILFEKRFHHIPVVNRETGKLEGIITSYDMMKLGLHFDEYSSIPVRNVMTAKLVTLQPNEKIGAAAQIFLRHLFHGLPIVDDDYQLVGIVTTHDILKYSFDKEYPNDSLEKVLRDIGV